MNPHANWSGITPGIAWAYTCEVSSFSKWRSSGEIRATVIGVATGGASFRYDEDSVFDLRGGEWLVAAPGMRRHKVDSGTILRSISFYASWPGGFFLLGNGFRRKIDDPDRAARLQTAHDALCHALFGSVLLPGEKLHYIRSVELLERQPTLLEHLEARAGINRWLKTLICILGEEGVEPVVPQLGDNRCWEILTVLDNWPLDQPFSLKRLAGRFSLSPRRIEQILASSISTTPRQYYEDRRFREVCRLLAETTLPAKAVCFRLGFKSLSQFSRWFGNRTGQAPTHWREQRQHLPL